jgi:hypothetical protein
MDCTLAALIACFSWSGFYLDTGISYQDRGETLISEYDFAVVDEAGGEIPELRYRLTQYTDRVHNPYVNVALGYEVNFRAVSIRLQGSHTSSVATGQDKGINAITLGARWYPFR